MSFISGIRGRKSSKSNAHETVPVDIWEPFEGLSFASLIPVSTEFTSLVSTPLDWKETPEAHVFMADLPGVKEEMKVEVEEEKVLKISGQRSRQNEEKSKWHRSSEKFLRTVRLPPEVDVEKVKAVLDHGVLTVTLPKEQEKKAHGRLIPIL